MSITGNPERDRMLREAIGKVVGMGKTPSLKLVSRALPEDFALDQIELDAMLAAMNQPSPDEPPPMIEADPVKRDADGHPLIPVNLVARPKSLEKIDPPHANEPAQPHDDTANSTGEPEIGEREARAILDHSNRRLSKARSAMVVAAETLKTYRADVSSAIYQWQLLFLPQQQTFESLIRDTIAANQQYKQDVKDGKIAPPPRQGRGRSYIDQTNGHGGTASDFARRSQLQTAGTEGKPVYKGYRRQSLPSQFQGRQIRPPVKA